MKITLVDNTHSNTINIVEDLLSLVSVDYISKQVRITKNISNFIALIETSEINIEKLYPETVFVQI